MSCQVGGSASPDSTQAAWRAAPMATYSSVAGRVTSMPRIEGASVRMATDFAPPPMSRMRLISAPSERISSRQSRWEHSRPSTNARARFSLVVLCRVRPVSEAVASGRFGVRSPSKYGTRVMPPAPGSALNASSASSS